MDILLQGKDIFKQIQECNRCGCVFETNRNDITVWYEPSTDRQTMKFECPSCFNLINFKQERDELNVKFVCSKTKER